MVELVWKNWKTYSSRSVPYMFSISTTEGTVSQRQRPYRGWFLFPGLGRCARDRYIVYNYSTRVHAIAPDGSTILVLLEPDAELFIKRPARLTGVYPHAK